MAKTISTDLKEKIVSWYLEDNLTMREIAARACCSLGLVSKVLTIYRIYNQVEDPTLNPRGRPSYLEPEDMDYLRTLLDANPNMYLDEVQSRLASVRNLHVSIATVSRALAQIYITRKRVSKVSAERDEELRDMWEADMAQYEDPDVFVCLDESAVDNKTFQRHYGWSEEGTPCVSRTTFLRGVRHSILPALTTDGIIALDIFEGSVTKNRFLTFMREQVAPQLNPFPAKRSVVILDNCSIHHDEELRQLVVEECGGRLVYLPPYSPDFNPIEEAFSAIKAWLRRHEHEYTDPVQLPWLVHQAATCVTAESARGWFKDCGYM